LAAGSAPQIVLDEQDGLVAAGQRCARGGLEGERQIVLDPGEVDLAGGAPADPRVEADAATALLDDPEHGGEAPSGPLPSALVVKKGSNICSRVWASMPSPVSLTDSITNAPGVTSACERG
jgi:hypothetical protein